MRLWNFIRRNYIHAICIVITLSFLALSVYKFPNALGRLIEGVKDFGSSIAYYFDELFGEGGRYIPTVNQMSSQPFTPPWNIPSTAEEAKVQTATYWQVFTSKETFNGYMKVLLDGLYNFSKILLLVLPFIVLFYVLIRRYFERENNDYNRDSFMLRAVKRTIDRTYTPIKNWVLNFIEFVKDNKHYWIIWLVMWLFNFNLITIVLEFFAFYFFIVVSFDFLHIYRQVFKLFADLSVVIDFIPVWVWIILAYILFCNFRKKIAMMKLRHMERKDRGFINARPIVYLVCGTMGKKKTTAITDMALSQEAMFRDKAFEKILENDLKFPFFPWINLEREIKRAMEYHEIYNLATCKDFIRKKFLRWRKHKQRKKIFDYDYRRYGMKYDDKLQITDVWKAIETYAQSYFIYIIQSSLIIANYSIRTDAMLRDLGNFPLWNNDFFLRDNRLIDSFSRHSHILDYDSLRLGRKVLENSKYANSFEFGVINLTEIGKERGNNLELVEKKKKDETTNQKNDLFNYWLKMVRHSATVDNFPFVRVITDEQRAASWGADARDLCEIVTILDGGEQRLAMPFFALEELLYSFIFSKFSDLYYRYRFVRADNTLLMYFFKWLTGKIQKYYTGIYNRFGFAKTVVKVEAGTQDGKPKLNYYYLMNKKIYAKRFSTDCYSDFFMKKNRDSLYGIDDLPEYRTEKASMNELLQQNSYFMNDLYDGFFGNRNN